MFVAGLREVTFVEEILSHLPTFMQALASISAEIQEVLYIVYQEPIIRSTLYYGFCVHVHYVYCGTICTCTVQ